MKIKLIQILLISAFAGSCNARHFDVQIPEAQSAADQEPEVEPAPDTTPDPVPETQPEPDPMPEPDPQGPEQPKKPTIPECTETKGMITGAKLISKAFSLSGKAQTLSYEMNLISCEDGKALPIHDLVVSFDFVIALASAGEYPITYTIKSAGDKTLTEGKFKEISNEDIFGARENYVIWKTDPMSFETADAKILFNINIGEFPVVKPASNLVDIYLRIGDSEPMLTKIDAVE